MFYKEIEILKKNENSLLFNGLPENTVLVVQPLIGVSDGSKVSRLKDAPTNADNQDKAVKAKMD